MEALNIGEDSVKNQIPYSDFSSMIEWAYQK